MIRQMNDFLFFHISARIGTRHVVTFMLFLGMANAYVMRTNMSVAIVAMVNHSAIINQHDNEPVTSECSENPYVNSSDSSSSDGEFAWDATLQGYLLSSFFYGYVLTQIPFGILAKRYGSKYFLGVGMLINSVFGLLVPISAQWGYYWLMVVRFIQGLGEVSTRIWFHFTFYSLSLSFRSSFSCSLFLILKWHSPSCCECPSASKRASA